MPSTAPNPASLPYVRLAEGLLMVPVEHNLQAHADEVRRAMAMVSPAVVAVELPGGVATGMERLLDDLPRVGVVAWKGEGGQALMVASDPCDPMIEAWRLAREYGLRVELVDDRDGAAHDPREPMPDEYAVRVLGAAQFSDAVTQEMPVRAPTMREWRMAVRLRRLVLGAAGGTVLFVGSLERRGVMEALLAAKGLDADAATPEPAGAPAVTRVLPLGPDDLGKVLREIPAVAWLYETFRQAHGPEDRFPILRALQHILRRAADRYLEEYDERINMTEWRNLYQYGRNLALVRGRFHPRFHELVVAAKGIVDDDFAAIVFEEALKYPPNQAPVEDEEPTGPFDQDEPKQHPQRRSVSIYADLGEGLERLESAYPSPEAVETVYYFKRRRPTMVDQLRWQRSFGVDAWLGGGICSWPPEDEFIENFFRLVRERAFQQISENHSASEQFTTSILDGLDIRETMRHWHEKKLYVRRDRVPPGRVGPVVVIWRDMPVDFPDLWQTCLYAENQNESDIAFYGRPLGREMVGPGITRTEYHGILSVYPASHIPDVWQQPALDHIESSSRLLISAAILLSEERYVAVVAPRPPDLELRMLARRRGRALIYLPLAAFSKSLLKRARRCHLLAGRRVRSWAADYIPRI